MGAVTTLQPLSSTERHSQLGPLQGQTVVIKYGGAAMEKPGLRELFARDVALVHTLGIGPRGELLNTDTDLVAGDVAAALGAVTVIFLSDVPGIRGRDGQLQRRVSIADLDVLGRQGVIDGGRLPKVEACARALKGGVGKACIVDGRLPNALLLKLFTHSGLGTDVVLEVGAGTRRSHGSRRPRVGRGRGTARGPHCGKA